MKKLALRLLFAFVLLPGLLAGMFFYLNAKGFFNISALELNLQNVPEGQEQFLKPYMDELQRDLQRYHGQSLWDVNLRGISKVVSANNWVESLNIKRSWPSTLSVNLRPYEVKLLFMAKSGKLVPIIKDGSFLNPVEAQRAPDVVLVSGEAFLQKVDLRKKAVDVIEKVPAEGAFSKKTISEMRYDTREGFWMTMIKSGTQVKLGLDQVELKSARVSQVVDYLETRQFDARVIDANLSKKVLVRLRKDP